MEFFYWGGGYCLVGLLSFLIYSNFDDISKSPNGCFFFTAILWPLGWVIIGFILIDHLSKNLKPGWIQRGAKKLLVSKSTIVQLPDPTDPLEEQFKGLEGL